MAEELDLDNLKALKVLGKGAMGTVFLVQHNSGHVALKVVDKSSSLHDGARRAHWEITVLSRLSHPFLPTLLGSFESNNLMGWAVPYCPGGDLNHLRYRQTDHIFSPAVVRFYLAEILCALHHLHSMHIVYRDLKPENVLIQQSGHVTLTDFDLSRTLSPTKTNTSSPSNSHIPDTALRKPRRNFRWAPLTKTPKSARVTPAARRAAPSFERSNSFVGTEEYIAPEVLRGEGHGFAVDWWALGVLAHEMVYGTTPFKGRNRKETFRNVLLKTPQFVGKKTALTDLISRLLEKDPSKRLGYVRGATEIKEHEFFRGVKWDLLTEVVRPPFIPSREEVTKPFADGLDVRGYFQSLKSPPSLPPSPLRSPSCEFRKNVSLPEF
ncbi:serine/threonine-protein kinase UCNL [Vigna radiata var. radiata]|uniref:non-specific serine/threonine protein kinase n=1 Tax=Vigna radiata var. radiata TaxID=3916 RepID=A0A1S3TU63_VIGRR|nr:serine/threonine-protein kinase UCNL [Vigna radiata var. radiata]